MPDRGEAPRGTSRKRPPLGFLTSGAHLPLLVLTLGLLLTVAATVWVGLGARATLHARFQTAIETNAALIKKRLEMNVALLHGVSGLFAAQEKVTRSEFSSYVDRLELARRYPGIFGVGYARSVRPADIPLVEEEARASGIDEFHVWPRDDDAELLTTIAFIEPMNERNRAALGFDMMSEPTRREAMERARDNGLPALSGTVTLVQEITEEKQAGFLIYVPLYSTGDVPGSVEERRASLVGYAYGVFRADDLFRHLYRGEPKPPISFQLYDGERAERGGLLHDSRDFDRGSVSLSEPRLRSVRHLLVYGHPWSVVVMSLPAIERPRERAVAPLVALAGTLVSLLLYSLVRRQSEARARAEALAAEMLAVNEERSLLLAKEQAAREVAEQANGLKDEFLATVSHELRTPLTAILGWTHLLNNRPSTPERTARGIEVIDRNARAQAQLVEDLLDVSRIISGKLRIETAPLNLVQVIDAALETVRPAADAKDIEIERRVRDPIELIGDAARLQQIVWNLLSNAVKFTSSGGRVSIRAARRGDVVEMEVSDTGRGIRREFLPYVFDRFRQAEGGTSREHGGLGIGLAIVRHLVELHGGTVQASSEGEGTGATFRVQLPVQRASRSRPSESAPVNHAERRPLACPDELRGARVLVVDDEDDARELVAELLDGCGLSVATARSAAEAFDLVREQPPDLIVSDIGMPQHDGVELIRRIRALPSTQGGDTRALAVTAYARAEERTRILRAGFDAHLAKPFEVDELLHNLVSIRRDPHP